MYKRNMWYEVCRLRTHNAFVVSALLRNDWCSTTPPGNPTGRIYTCCGRSVPQRFSAHRREIDLVMWTIRLLVSRLLTLHACVEQEATMCQHSGRFSRLEPQEHRSKGRKHVRAINHVSARSLWLLSIRVYEEGSPPSLIVSQAADRLPSFRVAFSCNIKT
jgi:hypothetical protein